MSVSKTTNNAFAGLCCTLSLFLLLSLFGCDATSDLKTQYQATGSWQGTIGTEQVRGIIAPDRSYHLAIVDAAGNAVGEYVGVISSIDSENIGSMTLKRLHSTEGAGATAQVTFKLSADRLFSLQGIELSRSSIANGPAAPDAVVGHWSLSAANNFTDVVVSADGSGTLSGGDGVNCRYSGALKLMDPAWNIFSLEITLTDIPGRSCNDSTYSGLAMLLPPENARRSLWFAANNGVAGGAKTFLGEWAETINVAPVARMTILGERPDQSVLVQLQLQPTPAVELSAQGSTDANHDQLTYAWSGIAPDGTSLNIVGGSAAAFTPTLEGLYTLTLTVSDGIASDTLTRTLRVEGTPDRFIGCSNGTVGNGTVLDTKTNLLWLQDAGCVALNFDGAANLWGFGGEAGKARVASLLADGVCGLSDGSVLGDWRLPTVPEFRQIVTATPFAAGPPALLNGQGTGQWVEGNVFVRVGAIHVPETKLYIYWTADPDPAPEVINNWLFVDFAYVNPAEWFGSQFANTRNSLWPVRALRTGEQCLPPPVP